MGDLCARVAMMHVAVVLRLVLHEILHHRASQHCRNNRQCCQERVAVASYEVMRALFGLPFPPTATLLAANFYDDTSLFTGAFMAPPRTILQTTGCGDAAGAVGVDTTSTHHGFLQRRHCVDIVSDVTPASACGARTVRFSALECPAPAPLPRSPKIDWLDPASTVPKDPDYVEPITPDAR
jgi:hypothetical protein